MLEATKISELPREILDYIINIYSKFRNHELWKSRFRGFETCNKRDKYVTHIKDIKDINNLTGIVKYCIPKGTFSKTVLISPIKYLETKVNLDIYKIPCISCGSFIDMCVKCKICDSHFCHNCSIYPEYPLIRPYRDNGITITEGCKQCV